MEGTFFHSGGEIMALLTLLYSHDPHNEAGGNLDYHSVGAFPDSNIPSKYNP